ncbi:hypothetical protein Unana1_02328 [Umbelopsis nana]
MNPTEWPNHGIDLNIPQANEGQADQLSMADTSGSHNEQLVGFGQAMFTLLEANDQTWLTSFKRLRSGSFDNALATLERHVFNDSSAQKDLLDSIIDKALQNKSRRQESTFHIAQYLMIYSNVSKHFCAMLQQQLMSDNNRSKLAILRAVSSIIDQWDQHVKLQLGHEGIDLDVRILVQFVPQCTAVARSSPSPTQLSVLASDLALIISRTYLQCIATTASVSTGTSKIIEVYSIDAQQQSDAGDLLKHLIYHWLNVSELFIDIAWRVIESFLGLARDKLLGGQCDTQHLEVLYRFWDATSRSLDSKHVRAKPKTMIKAISMPANCKAHEKWSWLLGSVCALLIMNGNRYQVLVPYSQADTEPKQKLDEELLTVSIQLTQAFLHHSSDALPDFEDVSNDLRVALRYSRGDEISIDELVVHQLRMIQQYPEHVDKFIDYSSANKLIKCLFQQLQHVSIAHSTCLRVIEQAVPRADPFMLIKDVSCYIGDTKSDINQLAQECVLMALSREDNSQECLFVFIECIRDVANGQSAPRQMSMQQLSPATLMSGRDKQQNSNVAESASEKVNQMVTVIQKWAEKASKGDWLAVLPTLARKTYASRKDPIYTTVWKTISAYISQDADLVGTVTSCCVDIMEQQPRLTEKMISDPTDEGALAVQDLTFARLCPLLILLTLPETAFITVVQDVDMSMARDFWNEDSSDTNVLAGEQSLSMRLLQALLVRFDDPNRAEHILEIQYIRPVALTVLAGLYGSEGRFLTLCRNKLRKLLEGWQQYHVVIKYWIYAFCVWGKGPWAKTLSDKDVSLLRQLKDDCFNTICCWDDIPNNDEFQKLKIGATEAMTLVESILSAKQ